MRLTVGSPQESSGSPQMTQERDTGFQSVQLRRRAADILILLLVSHIHSEREKSDLCFCSMGLIPAADKCNMIKAIKVTSWNVNGILNIVKRYKIL
ncbi:hypothetical protein F7725_002250 [Dissostichus mawsoni]|uniref:Uncharacterized protein n=1 Tax=Dissostichus mawsoni TaxID=36200 RepID=A0A7J5Y421_DISMA|nr:hypothetical protein F7725_002246 [Dissostichus mawsoni]KAF3843401.1 hypothetical protein F7725_002250 [Dissostichus mawsoni]